MFFLNFVFFCSRFMMTVHNKATVKSSATFRKRTCPLLYQNIKKAIDKILVQHLPQTFGVGITLDHWTSRAFDNYQSLTLHFIDEEFVMHKVTLLL